MKEIHHIPEDMYIKFENGIWYYYNFDELHWVTFKNRTVIAYLNKCYKGTTDRRVKLKYDERFWELKKESKKWEPYQGEPISIPFNFKRVKK